MASIPFIGEVQKAPVIQMAALYCIFFKMLSKERLCYSTTTESHKVL